LVDWDIWLTIGRLWPLILVAMGLDIILGRGSGIWPALAILVIILLFASGVWVVQTTGSVFSGELHSQEINQPIGDAIKAKIEVNFGTGQLEIGENAEEDVLVSGVIELTDSEVLDNEYRLASGIAYVLFDSHGQQYYPSWLFGDNRNQTRNWRIYLTNEIPIELIVDIGVGQSEIDLRDIQLSRLDIDCGVGEAAVYLPGDGQYTAYVNGGVGQLKVYVPKGLPVQIIVESGLGNNTVMGDYHQSGNVYTSSTYKESDERVNLYVDGGVGNISIIEIDQ
jgi:hypothetical protein